MNRTLLAALALIAIAPSTATYAASRHRLAVEAQVDAYTTGYSWHAPYAHTGWCAPVALVVPPNAELQTHWGWGVGNTRITTIWHQFQRNYPGPVGYDARMLQATPPWPSDTDQFGVYYIRGPW